MSEFPANQSAKIVEQALHFQTPDRLPVYDNFWKEFADQWRHVRHQGADAAIEDAYWLDVHISVAHEVLFPTEVGEVKREGDWIYSRDGWGRIVRQREDAYFSETVDRILKEPRDLDRIRFDPPTLDDRYRHFVEDVTHHRRKGRAVFVKIGGPFIRSTFFRGEEELLMDLVSDESFARTLVERVGEHLLQIGLESLKRSGLHDNGVWIYDDMCNLHNPMFSPAVFERIFLPVYKHMVSTLKAAGAKRVALHCDGNLTPLLDMVIEAGISAINPVEPHAGMDVVALMEKYAGRLAFIGGVCNSQILPRGSTEQLRRHVARIVDAGRTGGLIIGSHSIGPDVPIESYELYRQIVAERGNYRT